MSYGFAINRQDDCPGFCYYNTESKDTLEFGLEDSFTREYRTRINSPDGKPNSFKETRTSKGNLSTEILSLGSAQGAR